jgi:hypothetical protein
MKKQKYCIYCGKDFEGIGFFCMSCWMALRDTKKEEPIEDRFEILDL